MLALITGGSSGIGKNLAGAFLRRGDTVVIVAEGAEKLEQARQDLSAIAPSVDTVVCDVSDRSAVQAMVETVLDRHGCPDVLVNNAGVGVYRAFEQSPIEEIEKLIDVNLTGTLRCIHGFLPAMIARRSGHIVNIGSIAGLMPLTPCAAYGAAKQGVVGITGTLRWELREFGIKVHLICPGRVQTSFFDHPTFQQRPHRPETEKTVPIENVSKAIIKAVESGRYTTVIPWNLGVAAWLRNICPPAVDLALGRLMSTRTHEARSMSLPAHVDGT